MTGTLLLVVGPSGSGKDTLLDCAREHFAGSDQVYFPKRFITRPQDAGGEDHIAIDENSFEEMQDQGQFALHWRAHDLMYGVPQEIESYLDQGINVVVNVSRGIIDQAVDFYKNVTVISIKVNPTELERRLRERGRETEEDIASRLERAKAFNVSGSYVIEIDNSGNLEQSTQSFITAISKSQPMEKSA